MNFMTARPSDQRLSPRVLSTRPVKLFHPASGRFVPAHTCDVSGGGVLLQVSWPVDVKPGEAVDVYMPPDEHVVLGEKHRIASTVVRVLASGEIALIAIRFNEARDAAPVRAAA